MSGFIFAIVLIAVLLVFAYLFLRQLRRRPISTLLELLFHLLPF